MTSLSTVLGILPIALALGTDAESRVPMGVAIIGSLLFGMLLTLYVVPAMYSYLTAKEWKRAEVEKRTAAVSGDAVVEPAASQP